MSDTDDALDISNAISCIYVSHTDSVSFDLLVKLIDGKVPIKRLKFLDRNGLSVPVLTDAINEKNERERYNKDVNQVYISQQIREKIEECKDDENRSLLMPMIKFIKWFFMALRHRRRAFVNQA